MATIAELHEQRHALALYCPPCNRWEEADLPALIRRGHGPRSVVAARFRCRHCGEVAEKQLRPPVPTTTAAASYI